MQRLLLLGVVTALAACSFSAPGIPGTADDVPDGAVATVVGFQAATSLQDETSGAITVAVMLAAPAAAPVSVSYAVTGGSAVHGTDFAGATTGTLTFAPGETELGIELVILPDTLEEQDETLAIALASPTGGASLGIAQHTLTISSDVLPRVSFTLGTSSAPESAAVSFSVALDVASSRQVRVDYVLSGTATTADYGLRGGTFVFPAGIKSQSIAVGPVDDALDEDNETVRATLANSVNAVIVGASALRQHTLEDNDPLPIVAFVGTSRTVNENVTMTVLTVALDTPSGREVSVPFTVDAGSAAVNDDFSVMTGSPLVFAAGTTQRTITVLVVNDVRDEDTETLTIELGTPVNGTLDAASDTFDLSITDDDNPPQVRFDPTQAHGEALEGNADTNYDYRVELSAPSGKPISVLIEIGGGDVEANDFSVTGNPVVFMPGETMKNLRITVIGDTLGNPDDGNQETIVMQLPGAITNASRGSPATRFHKIIDDD
ncbi:MAG: hypothetical protein M3680_09025 [Myxococcota bacterium]|nr:hypothetical protein [Myxococcota bacterium]